MLSPMDSWLSGRALPSHGRGHRFESCTVHSSPLRCMVFYRATLDRPLPSGCPLASAYPLGSVVEERMQK